MSVSSSPELFRNMKRIPDWDPFSTFDEQSKDVQQFWIEEAKKVKNGITINGIYISGWLYWHTNFWKIFIDKEDGTRIPGIANLRDNEWFFAECKRRANEEKKGLIIFGCRRFGKALLDKELVYTKNGCKPINAIDVGEFIYDDQGKLTKVSGVYPQGVVRTYKVTLEDGRQIVCCGEHQWRIHTGESWSVRKLQSLLSTDYTKFSVQLNQPITYERQEWDISPSFYGSAIRCYLQGQGCDLNIDRKLLSTFIYTSKEPKKIFIDSLIRSANGIITGYDEIDVKVYDKNLIRFIQLICWSTGYYCKYEDKKLIISSHIDRVKIKSIEIYGNYSATCITVENDSHLFLTTDYVVTHNSAMEASVLACNATMNRGLDHLVVGFSDTDLGWVGAYLEYGFDHIHPFFRINRTSSDWRKGVVLGTKTVDNIRNIHARINMVNIDMGKKMSTQKGAGGTIHTAIIDEIGKGHVKKPYNAIKPSIDTEYGWRGDFILVGTGGEVELSIDAQDMISNPDSYNMILMDYSLLRIPDDFTPTWRQRKSGIFVPGQMAQSSHCGEKINTPLGVYLGKPDAKDLNKINIKVTNFPKATENLKEHFQNLLHSDRVTYAMEKMYFPLDLDDCFSKTTVNDLPVEAALRRRQELLEIGNIGNTVDVFAKEGGKLGYKFSNKPLPEFPFKGGMMDSPVIIYEPPVSNDYGNYIYTMGLDNYKQPKADTSSLGCACVFKRLVGINDPYANKLVAIYVSRPAGMDDFNRVVEILQDGYGAYCLMENIDVSYEQYLVRKNREGILFEGDPIVSRYIKEGAKQNNPKGLAATGRNQELLFKILRSHLWEKVLVGYDNDEGKEIYKLGVELIEDIGILNEIIDYHPGGNYDRLVAYSHALLLAKYYDDMNLFPKSKNEKSNDKRRDVLKKMIDNKRYVRRNPYRT